MKRTLLAALLLAASPAYADKASGPAERVGFAVASAAFSTECGNMRAENKIGSLLVRAEGFSNADLERNPKIVAATKKFIGMFRADPKEACKVIWQMFGTKGELIPGLVTTAD